VYGATGSASAAGFRFRHAIFTVGILCAIASVVIGCAG
jgi:hypothetical protein